MSLEVNNSIYDGLGLEEIYNLLLNQLPFVFENEINVISNSANFSSLIYNALPDLNWAGFYFKSANFKSSNSLVEELILGPFAGKTACVRIPFGKGVCGKSAIEQKVIIVDDVHQFPGHIACDANSNSEIVLPIIKESELFGVFDIDSPKLSRFTELDKKYLVLLLDKFIELTEIESIKRIY